MLPCQSRTMKAGTLAGHLALRHADVNRFEWSDVTLSCLSPPLYLELSGIYYLVLQNTVHNEVVISVGCGQRSSTSMPLCDSSSFSISLLQPADNTVTFKRQWLLPSENILFVASQ
ncbi:hypothetical protein ILYODFUR_014177 [Ilyodon furcidens]|uniref:Uncharacterized protein n=1 Tax=Ilyodon furcidens TaxID=33524 RepID=A0ABV0SWY4_9TELE